jgi:hypothetical protein
MGERIFMATQPVWTVERIPDLWQDDPRDLGTAVSATRQFAQGAHVPACDVQKGTRPRRASEHPQASVEAMDLDLARLVWCAFAEASDPPPEARRVVNNAA